MRLSHLGDVVHSLPVFHALRQAWPRALIAWAVQPEFAPLVEQLSGLDRVILFARHGGPSAWWHMRRDLRRFRPDWTIDAQGNLKSAAVTWLSGAARRSGWAARDWTEPLGSIVLTDPAPPLAVPGKPHAVDRNLHLAAYVAGPQAVLNHTHPRSWLKIGKDELEAGRGRLAALFPNTSAPAVLLQVAGPGDVRSWPLENQRLLLERLARSGTPVLAISGPAEEASGRRLEEELVGYQEVKHWVGQRGLPELAGLLAAAAERGARFVGCDSGPLHLAIACGLPVICLAGPQDAARTGPWPPPGPDSIHQVLRAPQTLYCAPCLARQCARTEGLLCMEGIEVEAVINLLGLSPARVHVQLEPTAGDQ